MHLLALSYQWPNYIKVSVEDNMIHPYHTIPMEFMYKKLLLVLASNPQFPMTYGCYSCYFVQHQNLCYLSKPNRNQKSFRTSINSCKTSFKIQRINANSVIIHPSHKEKFWAHKIFISSIFSNPWTTIYWTIQVYKSNHLYHIVFRFLLTVPIHRALLSFHLISQPWVTTTQYNRWWRTRPIICNYKMIFHWIHNQFNIWNNGKVYISSLVKFFNRLPVPLWLDWRSLRELGLQLYFWLL